jgi:hypothetical protein
MTTKHKTTEKAHKWYKYTGHEWLKGAKHEVEVLKAKKACKDIKIVEEIENEKMGSIHLYWVYTYPKVNPGEFKIHKEEWKVPSYLHNGM